MGPWWEGEMRPAEGAAGQKAKPAVGKSAPKGIAETRQLALPVNGNQLCLFQVAAGREGMEEFRWVYLSHWK